ncbi:MAG: ABC transporter permease [Rectinemataceae bacterium]|nr:ABC transporter permease [Rectinemataceae bacterium]
MNKKPMLSELKLAAVLLPLMVALTILSPRFLTIDNLTNVIWSVCLIGILSAGAIYPRITGGIDLSLGSMAALTGIIADMFMNRFGMNWMLSMALTIVIGGLIGLFNGFIVAKIKVPAFVVTMAAKTYLYGVGLVVSQGAMLAILGPKPFIAIGTGRFLGLPNPIYIMVVLVLISQFVLKRTAFGRKVMAVGANEVAAKLSGVDPDRIRLQAYAISGMTSAVGGIVLASLTQQVFAAAASGIELEVMTALVIGGTSPTGGKGSVIGGLLGAVMVAFIINGLNLMNVPAPYHTIVTGVVIILALLLNEGYLVPKKFGAGSLGRKAGI